MPTDNHTYNTPGKGQSDWDVPLIENITDLDTDVEIRDTAANRATYTPKAGAKYLATDTGAVHIGDGTAWTKLGRLGDDTGATSLTLTAPTTVQANEVLTREVHTVTGQQFHVDADSGGSLHVADGGYLHING